MKEIRDRLVEQINKRMERRSIGIGTLIDEKMAAWLPEIIVCGNGSSRTAYGATM